MIKCFWSVRSESSRYIHRQVRGDNKCFENSSQRLKFQLKPPESAATVFIVSLASTPPWQQRWVNLFLKINNVVFALCSFCTPLDFDAKRFKIRASLSVRFALVWLQSLWASLAPNVSDLIRFSAMRFIAHFTEVSNLVRARRELRWRRNEAWLHAGATAVTANTARSVGSKILESTN